MLCVVCKEPCSTTHCRKHRRHKRHILCACGADYWVRYDKPAPKVCRVCGQPLDKTFGKSPEMEANLSSDGVLTHEESGDKGYLESKSERITTLEQLLEAAEVDLGVWEVERWVANKWEVGSKGADKKLRIKPLWQVKAWLRRRVAKLEFDRLRAELVENFAGYVPYPPITYPETTDHNLLEISIPDLHFGKLSWHEEAGENYDVKLAEKAFLWATNDLLRKSEPYEVERILFVIGHDFFNVDSQQNTTTGGTPQHEDGRTARSFRLGCSACIKVVDTLQQRGPVTIMVVKGNHDEERCFYLGEFLRAWYRDCSNVEVDNRPSKRKYMRYGVNLLGFTHGDSEPPKNLPLIMATEAREMWADAVCCEFHCGHLHKSKSTEFLLATEEYNEIRVRILPSLVARDAWHAAKGYKARRCAEAYLWNRDTGYSAHFSSNLMRAA